MFHRARRWLDNFTSTIRAGYYAPAAPENPHEREEILPRKPWVLTAMGVFSLGYALATNTVIGLAIEASLVGVTAGIGLAAAAGAGLMGALYLKSKKSGAAQISETNMAGQRVRGSRADLFALHQAQRRIISLTAAFEDAAAPKIVEAEVQAVIAETAGPRSRVKVLDAHDAPGHKKTYEFVRPVVTFADAAAPAGKTVRRRAFHHPDRTVIPATAGIR